MNKHQLLGGASGAGVSLIFIIIGLVDFSQSLSMTANGIKTQGVVVDHESQMQTFAWGTHPIVKFYGPDGTPFTFRSSKSSIFTPSRGKQVSVLYRPDDPSTVVLASNFYLWGFPVIFTGIGLIFIVMTVIGVFKSFGRLESSRSEVKRRADGRLIERPPALESEEYRRIREQLLASSRYELWTKIHGVKIVVDNGIVEMWGVVDSEPDRQALRVAVESIPGVRGVSNRLTLRKDLPDMM
ncbi:MAG: DUF3592 domain-containing protein [Candidatus Methylomirabilales bacterium]